MSVATFQTVTLGSASQADVPVLGDQQDEQQRAFQLWTSVTASGLHERSHWRPTLLAFPGLRTALNVRVYEAPGDIAVEDPQTGIFGEGADLDAAIVDFQTALHDHLDVLVGDDALAPPLQRQLEILRGYFSAP